MRTSERGEEKNVGMERRHGKMEDLEKEMEKETSTTTIYTTT
jgi:hypothetical protein